MPYQKPSVLTERTGLPGNPLGNTNYFIPTVVGKTLGQTTQTSRKAVDVSDGNYVSINGIGVSVGDDLTYDKVAYTDSTKLTAAVPHRPIRSLMSVSTTASDPFKREYLAGTDFVLDKATGILDFTDAPAIVSTEMGSVIEQTGGLIAAGDYQFAVVVRDANDNTTLAAEYSSGGVDYFTVANSTASVKINWAKIRNAASYLVYGKPQSASVADWSLLATIADPTVNTYTQSAVIASGAVTLPVANTTKHTPVDAGTVYISYSYPVYAYNSPKRYFSAETLQNDQGIGSELANAGRIVMGPAGVGQAAGSMYTVAINESNGDVVGYQDGIEACEGIQELILMSTTSTSDTVNETLIAHCESMSTPESARERFGFVGTTSAVMADTNVQLTLNKILALNGSNRGVYVITDGGHPHMDSWQNTPDKYNLITGTTDSSSYTLNVATDGQWHAIATMGRVTSLGDPAVPATNKQVYGISGGLEGTVAFWNDARKDAVAANGGLVLESRFNNLFVRHGLTVSQTSVEDSEISVVLAEAYMAKVLRDNHQQFIGEKLTDDLIKGVDRVTRQSLAQLKQDVIIRNASNITVYQDTTNPTWVYVVFSYSPIYPTNVIKFEWGFDIASPA